LAQEDEVLSAQDGVLELRDDALLVAHDAREERVGGAQAADQVVTEFLFDGPGGVTAGAEVTDRPGSDLSHASQSAMIRPRPVRALGGSAGGGGLRRLPAPGGATSRCR